MEKVNSKIKSISFYSLLLAVFVLLGCEEEERKPRTVPLNSFSMDVNGKDWKPYEEEGNPCYSTFSGTVNGGSPPRYTFYAYRDPAGIAEWWSENMLRMQLREVPEPGPYLLDGTYKEDFDSYFMFQTREDLENHNRYVNDPERSDFAVTVQEFIPGRYSSTKGIKGSFSGILYNEADPLDSLVIENGEFTFGFIGVGYDGHCD